MYAILKKGVFILLSFSFLLSSCTEDPRFTVENLQNIDPTITLFQNGLSVPLGEIDPVSIEDLLGSSDFGGASDNLSTDEEGNVVFGFSSEEDIHLDIDQDDLNDNNEIVISWDISLGSSPSTRVSADDFDNLGSIINAFGLKPELLLDLRSNLTFNSLLNVKVIPVSNGRELEDHAVYIDGVKLYGAASVSSEKLTGIFVGVDESRCPDGYQFVEHDLTDILSVAPDNVRFVLTIKPENPSAFDPKAGYYLKVGYALRLPLIIPDGFEFEYSDCISVSDVLPEEISNGYIGVKATVVNGFPLSLDASISFLDGENKPVAGVDGISIKIAPSENGRPVESEIEAYVSLDGFAGKIEFMDINLKIASVGGVHIKSTDFIQLKDISLHFPEGITIRQ